jgi:hypothetical protein
MSSRYHVFEVLQAELAESCPEEILRAVSERLASWKPQPHLFFRYASYPAPGTESGEACELHVAVLVGHGPGALLDVRSATDGFSESLIPLRAIDRLRLVRKPDRTQVEIRHGDCISWLERKEDDSKGSDLEDFLVELQKALA